ncbi:rabenosyn-5 [Anthonomus grandis grandis]|uniref:rabenosyn-5 n=1 Tax=Anthonomus grandis grandis TaxID=2921223 RepID=UPI0021668112|nr:rabenosyn-5 [Anthonomus grandis grandis]XP_050300673.1 rabenosyn-5 [Anthonomus grandis grandis]
MADGAAIKEGFICPICIKDFRTPNNLLSHFQDQHSEEQDLLKSIKEIYGKAKKRILKLEDQDLQTFKEQNREVYFLEPSPPQDVGPFRSHTDYLKDLRREKLDHRTAETNRLIIRLDRLLRTFGPDRKQQEQELVEWLDGSSVTRCPSCAASFNIARRQHHCRLCGSIMCKNCSYFLPYDQAYRIVAPINNTSDKDYSGKETDTLRICDHCLKMLESRQRVQINQMLKPTIWQLYSLLEKNRKQVQSFVDLYNKMYDSLTSGETTFLLQDLQSLRSTIAEKAQIIDTLSKKIASEPVDPEMPKAVLVQNNIRKSTSNYIKDFLLTLPQPPSSEDIENIREKLAMSFREESDIRSSRQPKIQTVAVTTGWSPAPANIEPPSQDEDDNPLKEQMRIVRNYIDQARKAQRYEEVASLEENLRMLQDTYRRQRTALG